jgi:hypothetical protein
MKTIPSVSATRKRLIILSCALLLGACSALQLAYKQADSLILFWVGRYVDLNDEQTKLARVRLAELMAWHRTNELPRYASVLEATTPQLAGDVSAAQVCNLGGEVRAAVVRAADRALPAVGEIVVTFNDEQLSDIRKKLVKNNKKYDDENRRGSPEQRWKNRLKRTIKSLEDEYGNLSSAQEAAVADLLKPSPWNVEEWAVLREARQAELMGILKSAQGAAPAKAAADLSAYLLRNLNPSDTALREKQAALTQFNCEFTAQVHKLTTPEQRSHAQKKLKGYMDDIRALVKG